jgi:carbon storage regulator
MLVLSRYRDQAIMIGDDVKITIIDVRGDKVRLGIEAPRELPVHREEVYELVKQQKLDKEATEEQKKSNPE